MNVYDISLDANKFNRTVMTVITNRLKGISKKGRKLNPIEKVRYGKSAMLRYLANEPICATQNPNERYANTLKMNNFR